MFCFKSATKSFYGDVVHWVWIGGVSRDIHHGGDQQFGSGEIHRGALVVIQNIERDFGGIDDFMLCRYFGEGLPKNVQKVVSFISQHSLGIYLLHPIFLWPMKEFGWYTGHPGWVILCGLC